MLKFNEYDWDNLSGFSSRAFICWNCNQKVASQKAYFTIKRAYDGTKYGSLIYICPHCNAPVLIDDKKNEVLLPLPGIEIKNIPENLKLVYNEIRKCMQNNCINGAIMLMRKLIMHIAVEEGDIEGRKFEQYVDFLCTSGIVPKKSKNKADSVRTLGNSTNHEIENRSLEEAQNCFEFIELLLKVNYEFADQEEDG
jgi:hypothetical protein